MAEYRNQWFNPMHGHDPEIYRTDAKPIEYRGYFFYERIKGRCWDIVRNGVCVGQRAGEPRSSEIDKWIDHGHPETCCLRANTEKCFPEEA